MAADVASASGARRWLWTTVVGTATAFAVAIFLAPAASAPAPQALTWLLFLTSSVHVASTGFLFSFPEVRQQARVHRVRYRTVPALLIVASASVAAFVQPATLAWLLLPYFGWQQWHYQKQNLGLAALAASSQELSPLFRPERQALLLSGGAGVVGLVAHPALLQVGVHAGTGPLFMTAMVVFALAAAAGVISLSRRSPEDRSAGFTLVYLMALLFSAPLFVFDSPYAAVGGMTMAHGLQYLTLMAMISSADGHGVTRVISLAVFANVALIGGGLLNAASHLHSDGAALRLVYGGYLGLVMAHFVIDAGIWRLRDPVARAFVSGRLPALVPPGAPSAGAALARSVP